MTSSYFTIWKILQRHCQMTWLTSQETYKTLHQDPIVLLIFWKSPGCFFKIQFPRCLSCISGGCHHLAILAKYTRRYLFIIPSGHCKLLHVSWSSWLSPPSHSCHPSFLEIKTFLHLLNHLRDDQLLLPLQRRFSMKSLPPSQTLTHRNTGVINTSLSLH